MADKNIIMAERIARAVDACGGTAYYIGGFVRDRLRGEESKDIDIEVHGIAPKVLEGILDTLGGRISIGESFGIYRLKGYSLDIAMPRKEKNRGRGHRDFEVFVDPFIGTRKAAMRRDFTINALMENVLSGEVVDHFGGIRDLHEGVLRHINDATFAEDPLRVLRAAQFAARFEYRVAEETVALCRKMDLSTLPKERIIAELQKALLKAQKPSVFFEVLRGMEQLGVWFPELSATIGVPQSPVHHAEGDVWTHTMMVVDEAAAFRDKAQNTFGFMLAAVAHDFGKVLCTEKINGVWHAYNHEREGLPLIRQFLQRLTSEKALTHYVLNLCEHHMRPNMLAHDNASLKATNKMFDASVDPTGLIYLATADGLGKISTYDYISYEAFLTERLQCYRETMQQPYVQGKDLLEAGVQQTERFHEYIEFAHKLRLAGVKKYIALRQVLALAKENKDV